MDQQPELVETAALDGDTIAAIATPPGKGGVAIVRLSGHHAWSIYTIKKTGIRQKDLRPEASLCVY